MVHIQTCTIRACAWVCARVCVFVCAALTVSGLAAVLLHDFEEDSRVVSLNRPRVVLDCFVRQEEAG